jgi:hypothetical protein
MLGGVLNIASGLFRTRHSLPDLPTELWEVILSFACDVTGSTNASDVDYLLHCMSRRVFEPEEQLVHVQRALVRCAAADELSCI